MTQESTPNQESAPEKAPNLDAVLEGAINQALPNEDDAPRIILGTNYFVTGTFGDYENKDQIHIT